MGLFKKSSLEPLAVSMSGLKLGDRLLVVGASDPPLIAALAAKTGLTGRVCVVDDSDARSASTAAAVEREGALMESFTAPLSSLPFESASFDVVVVRNALAAAPHATRLAVGAEVFRVLRPGGRALVIDSLRAGLARLLGQAHADYEREGGALRTLQSAGFRGARTLAEREGLRFVEGTRSG